MGWNKISDIEAMANRIAIAFGGPDDERLLLDLAVRSWHAGVKPGSRVVMESPKTNDISYGEVIDTGADAAVFAHPTLIDYRMAMVYTQLVPDGEQKVIHLGMVRAFVTEEGFLEAKRRGWPNDKGFAKLLVDHEMYKKVCQELERQHRQQSHVTAAVPNPARR